MDLIEVCPSDKYLTLKELLPLYEEKGIEVTIKNLQRIYMKAYRIGYVSRKRLNERGRAEYLYKKNEQRG